MPKWPPPDANTAFSVYTFEGVALEESNLILRINGQVRHCPDLVFRFLLLLCKSPQKVVLRQELIEHLWPGGQVVSDEAITQVLFRARAILGPHSRAIRTIRAKGVRLDAVVSVGEYRADERQDHNSAEMPGSIADNEPITELELHQAAGNRGRHAFRPNLKRQWFIICLALLAVSVTTLFWYRAGQGHQVVDLGYGLTSADLHAENRDTARLIRKAFKSEATGERKRSFELFEAIHRNDHMTPVPALFLALWISGSGDAQASNVWLERAKTRSDSFDDVYLNLLLDYVTAEINGDPEQVISRAGALLDIRPGAWRMHHARAHLLEFIGQRSAALSEVSQIEVTQFGDRRLELVIADRASMGDIAGAQAMLDRLPVSSDPATHAFLSGRLDWSRGDLVAAHDHWIEAADFAYPIARMDIYRRSLLYAGAIEAMLGRNGEAQQTLKLARSAIGDSSLIDYTDATLLLAHVYSEAGLVGEMQTELQQALNGSTQVQADWIHLTSLFAVWRMWPEILPAKPQGLTADIDALWLAMEKFRSGEVEASRAALAAARAQGIGHSRLSDEARWLEWKLGEAVSAELPLDPPFPPLSRLMVRREVKLGRSVP